MQEVAAKWLDPVRQCVQKVSSHNKYLQFGWLSGASRPIVRVLSAQPDFRPTQEEARKASLTEPFTGKGSTEEKGNTKKMSLANGAPNFLALLCVSMCVQLALCISACNYGYFYVYIHLTLHIFAYMYTVGPPYLCMYIQLCIQLTFPTSVCLSVFHICMCVFS